MVLRLLGRLCFFVLVAIGLYTTLPGGGGNPTPYNHVAPTPGEKCARGHCRGQRLVRGAGESYCCHKLVVGNIRLRLSTVARKQDAGIVRKYEVTSLRFPRSNEGFS